MFSFSVMTPYYSEETVYSRNDLDLENEDGVSENEDDVSIIFYLQKIFPDHRFPRTTSASSCIGDRLGKHPCRPTRATRGRGERQMGAVQSPEVYRMVSTVEILGEESVPTTCM